jgi:molybdopterin-guanine dinucleotide biosynthesis protein
MAGMNQVLVYLNDADFEALNAHATETGEDYGVIMVEGFKRSAKDLKAEKAAKAKAEREKEEARKAKEEAENAKQAAALAKNGAAPVEGAAKPIGR